MKAWQAFLLHLGTSAAQGALGVQFFQGGGFAQSFGNVAIQIAAQSALTAAQAYVATRNSKTDPNGKPLVEFMPGQFTTSTKVE